MDRFITTAFAIAIAIGGVSVAPTVLGSGDHGGGGSPSIVRALKGEARQTANLFDLTKADQLGKHRNLRPIGQ